MKNKTLLLLALFTLPLTVKAGGSELHGGDSVVCFQTIAQKQQVEKILRQNKVASQMGYIRQDPFDDIDLNTVTVETLDVWEAKNSVTVPVKFVNVENVENGVKDRINVLNTKMSLMAQKMQEAYDGFYAPSKWLASSTGVLEIDDSRELINYTKLCIPVQIAVQTSTRVYYDARLYSRMNEANKVALILHELLYSWLKKYSQNSLNVRKYVGMMMREDFVSYPTDSLIQEFLVDYDSNFRGVQPSTKILCPAKAIVEGIEIGFSAVIAGVNPDACKVSERLIEARYKNRNDLVTLSTKLSVKVEHVVLSDREWNPNGIIKIAGVSLVDGQIYTVTETTTEFKIETIGTDMSVENGIVNGLPDRTKRLEILGQEITLREPVLNYEKLPSGKLYLASFQIEDERILKSAGFRKMKKCSSGSYVVLNPAGLVESCK